MSDVTTDRDTRLRAAEREIIRLRNERSALAHGDARRTEMLPLLRRARAAASRIRNEGTT